MNKKDVIDAVADSAEISKAQAGKALEAVLDSITGALKKKDSVVFVGFGTFSVSERPARQGHNPQNRQPLQIEASTVPKFKAGKTLKEAVNNG